MAAPAHHTICRQFLHVEVEGTESEAQALQRALPGLCRKAIQPALEEVFRRCAPEGHLLIDRLEVDVGRLAPEDLERRLPGAVAEALEQLLRQWTEHVSRGEMRLPEEARYRTGEEALLEAFAHFLQTGTLPWWYPLPEGQGLEGALLHLLRTLHKSPSATVPLASALLRAALSAPSARLRLIRQFTLSFLQTLLALLRPQESRTILDLLLTVRQQAVSDFARAALEQEIFHAAFSAFAAEVPLVAQRLFHEALRQLPQTARAELTETGSAGACPLSSVHEAAAAASLSTLTPALEEAATSSSVVTASAPEDEGRVEAMGDADAEAGEGVYVDNAGLILLHPFLPRFFEKLGVAQDDRLLDAGRAVCLLHHLASGELLTPEYRATLCKLLCGVPLQRTFSADAALTDREREEAQTLLQAVIDHWGALRNASPDALRGTFLLRSGKLSRDGAWLLQVEPQTSDILLDQLPWGFSMLKLPWMQKMLWVEWR